MSNLPPLALALRAYRDRRNLTQKAAAAAFGIPKTTWSDMEQRATSPMTHSATVAGTIILELIRVIDARSKPDH